MFFRDVCIVDVCIVFAINILKDDLLPTSVRRACIKTTDTSSFHSIWSFDTRSSYVFLFQSIYILDLTPVAGLGSRCLLRIAKAYAEAELVALAEAEHLDQGTAHVVVGKEAHGAAEAD